MNRTLTWLHISDIHFHPDKEWRDAAARAALLKYLGRLYDEDDSLRPDLVFCTGDIAFGETGGAPLSGQYEQAAAFFDRLLEVCGRGGAPLPKGRLFVVPGNHDVNRKSINSLAQSALRQFALDSLSHAEKINQLVNDRAPEFTDAVKRLDEYGRFVKTYLPHQPDADGRHCYAEVVDVGGLSVGVAGFNSAWSCAGPEDDRTIWMAARWQFSNAAQAPFKDADVRIGLVHHPLDWLNEADRDVAKRRAARDFHFWLHGHSHNAWVEPLQSHVTIAAGAVGAEQADEFGVNIVRLDLDAGVGSAHLHAYSPRDEGWVISPVAEHAPLGRWRFTLPSGLSGLRESPAEAVEAGPAAEAAPAEAKPPAPLPAKRIPKLFGRDELLREAGRQLRLRPFLLVYGLRGNGKTSLIEALGETAPLSGKGAPVRHLASIEDTADELFRQFAPVLGDTAETPRAPSGTAEEIADKVRRRYPNPRPAWVWIDRAHNLLDDEGFFAPEVQRLLLGIEKALGERWRWVFEFRERPAPGLLGALAAECEVPGLDKESLGSCLADAAPPGCEAAWRYGGNDLTSIYQWLGGGQGGRAHPLAVQLLIEVARGHGETPLEAKRRHLSDFEQKIEERLLRDLYHNVLSAHERRMLQALSLYRGTIPQEHMEDLERRLGVPGAWEWINRRCLLSADASHYYLHSFIAEWVRSGMGYEAHAEDAEADDFDEWTPYQTRAQAQELHAAVAACWLDQLRGKRYVNNVNISRAVEAFHHLVAAGEAGRVQEVAVELLAGNREWAIRRIERLYRDMFKANAPVAEQRRALEYAAALNPDDPKVQRFLGECWVKEEGRGSLNALRCFENACRLTPDFPANWANLGRTLLAARGREGAEDFLRRLSEAEEDYPRAVNDHVRAVQADCLEKLGRREEAAEIRRLGMKVGSRNPAFYNDEAKELLEAGDFDGALKVLDSAVEKGCANDISVAIRADVLQQSGRKEEASELRMAKISAGICDAAFYNDEAKARMEAGDFDGALKVLDMAEEKGCADRVTGLTRSSILRRRRTG